VRISKERTLYNRAIERTKKIWILLKFIA
jgi:hypothetical protein